MCAFFSIVFQMFRTFGFLCNVLDKRKRKKQKLIRYAQQAVRWQKGKNQIQQIKARALTDILCNV